jgi:chromosome segregation ATPase
MTKQEALADKYREAHKEVKALADKYREAQEEAVALADKYREARDRADEALDALTRADKYRDALAAQEALQKEIDARDAPVTDPCPKCKSQLVGKTHAYMVVKCSNQACPYTFCY